MFKGFNLMMALGNCDTVVSQLKKKALATQVDAVFFSSFEGELEGRNIFITHGHEEGQIMDAVLTKRFEYIFYGHTHHQKDEMRGNSRLICPGALGGMKREVRSFGMIDFSTGVVEWVEIPGLV
jgi:predicted phosphodiesterase